MPFSEPLKVAGPTVEAAAKAAKEAAKLGEPAPVVVDEEEATPAEIPTADGTSPEGSDPA